MFGKKNTIQSAEEKRRRISEMRSKCAMARLSRQRTCNDIKTKIDKNKSERLKLREQAIAALERGDELEAKRLCTLITPVDLSIDRGTKLFMLNLKAMEAISTKEIILNTIDVTADLDLGGEFIDNDNMAELMNKIEKFELEMQVTSDAISEITQSERANEIFDSLVMEVNKKQELSAFNKVDAETNVPPITSDNAFPT